MDVLYNKLTRYDFADCCRFVVQLFDLLSSGCGFVVDFRSVVDLLRTLMYSLLYKKSTTSPTSGAWCRGHERRGGSQVSESVGAKGGAVGQRPDDEHQQQDAGEDEQQEERERRAVDAGVRRPTVVRPSPRRRRLARPARQRRPVVVVPPV